MPNYLLFLSEQKAIAAEEVIVSVGFYIYQQRGWSVVDNAIVSKKASNHEDDLNANKTKRWAIPRYSEDGYWFLPDPREFLDENILDLPEAVREGLKILLLNNIEYIEIDGWIPTLKELE